MINKYNSLFIIETNKTSYLFTEEDGILYQLYYGQKLNVNKTNAEQIREALMEKSKYNIGNSIDSKPGKTFDNCKLEISSLGKGDVRYPSIQMQFADGCVTNNFRYSSYEIIEGGVAMSLPTAACADETLLVKLMDDSGARVTLSYSVFEACDVICRNVTVTNTGKEPLILQSVMSMQLDLDYVPARIMSFGGSWAHEMNRFDTYLSHGRYVGESLTGTSSSRKNPFFIVCEEQANEEHGLCYGVNLIYSGNHYESVEVNSYGKVRIMNGIHEKGFSWTLLPGQSFESPQSVLTVTKGGYAGISENMHAFVKNHIVRGRWAKKERPVLLNSWEAAYFKFDEAKLLKLAKAGKEAGIELFVMDDGWFGKRNDDKTSLGDWQVNLEKLPNGVKGLADKIHQIGMDFGIWIEPEMVNEDSDLYRAHPDWVLRHPGSEHATGRNQMILDMTREDVVSYLIETFTALLESADINYVKWDMNRIVSDAFSQALPADRQGEVLHRYVMGVYALADALTKRFPDVLFEGCASGGNRFDLGMLCFFPQIWGSDDTDAYERAHIQTGYSYGYPLSTVSAHVSSVPNHQTLRRTPFETRFAVAMAGVLGYECNLAELSKEEFEAVKEQIAFYKAHRKTLQFGTYHRIFNGQTDLTRRNLFAFNIVSEDQTESIAVNFLGQFTPNMPGMKLFAKGLIDDGLYKAENRQVMHNVKDFGDLINTVSPVHIKQGSLVHNVVAKVVKMEGERESYVATGALLSHAGISLKQGYVGTGFDEDVRLMYDYGARVYVIKSMDRTDATEG